MINLTPIDILKYFSDDVIYAILASITFLLLWRVIIRLWT